MASSWWTIRPSPSRVEGSGRVTTLRSQMSDEVHSVPTMAEGVMRDPKPPGPVDQDASEKSGVCQSVPGSSVVNFQIDCTVRAVGTKVLLKDCCPKAVPVDSNAVNNVADKDAKAVKAVKALKPNAPGA